MNGLGMQYCNRTSFTFRNLSYIKCQLSSTNPHINEYIFPFLNCNDPKCKCQLTITYFGSYLYDTCISSELANVTFSRKHSKWISSDKLKQKYVYSSLNSYKQIILMRYSLVSTGILSS